MIYLSPKQVEEEYGIKESTLKQWRHKRIGPDYFKVGHLLLVKYKRVESEEFFENSRRECIR